MTHIMVDVEADGPIPGDYSMLSFGAIVVEPAIDRVFYTTVQPLPGAKFDPEALAHSGHTREQTLTFTTTPTEAMTNFVGWLLSLKLDGYRFISDNNGFDWQWINWYFHHFLGYNPFGHSSSNLGSLYKGMQKSMKANFKRLRKTKHDHNALNDCKGNAEAMLEMVNQGLHIPGLSVRPPKPPKPQTQLRRDGSIF